MAFIGTHTLIYSSDAQATRAALRDIFGFEHIDAGDGWLIFRLPPAELGFHPSESRGPAAGRHAVSLMCDDIHATVLDLRAKGIEVQGEPADHGYGITVMVTLPGGVEIQVYEPRHPLAIDAT
jgi:catechol 2,3-dioxygenase-like lactoylglutathione lyase family enzyme